MNWNGTMMSKKREFEEMHSSRYNAEGSPKLIHMQNIGVGKESVII